MKKILASLAALAIIGSSVTSVVSCGPITFAKLMNRTVSTDVYRGTYKSPISNWSSAVTMQLEDSIILTNAQDTLLATDQHNNFEGDLADAWISSPDAKSWSFHVRDNDFAGHWTSLNGKGKQEDRGKIKSTDFYNAFRYIFNPNNMSQVIGVWQTVIQDGDRLNQFIKDVRDKTNSLYDEKFTIINHEDNFYTMQSNRYLDRAIMAFNWKLNEKEARDLALNDSISTETLVQDSFENGKIINNGKDQAGNNQSEYNLTFNLSKPAPYFESMAAFLSFAPIPDIAVKYLNFSSSGANYGRALGNKFGYQTIYYSGAYVVKDYNPTLRIKMEQNKFYFNRKSLKVKELNYAYIGNVDVSRQRFYFETGDISEVNVQPTDLAGWDKYVGSDYLHPKFEGANLTNRPQAGTYAMIYNYNSTRNESGTANANIAIAQRSVRGFIRYVFNRSKVASYYSKAMDKTDTSTMLRNTWTSKNLVVYKENGVEKDYVDYMAQDYFDPSNNQTTTGWLNQALMNAGLSFDYDNWSKKYGQVEIDGQTKNALTDGYDTFLRNDLLGALIFVDDDRGENPDNAQIIPKNKERFENYVKLIGKYDQGSENQKLSYIKQQVSEDLAKYGINNATTLTWLANGSAATTINNNIKDAVRTFNQNVGGNSPINIVVRESTDMNDYMVQINSGLFTMISNGWVPDYSDPYTFIHTAVAGGDLESYTGFGRLFDQKFENQKIKLTVRPGIPHPEAYDDLIKRMEAFTNRVSEIDKNESVPNTRYQEFANIENYAMIESMVMLPMFFQFLDEPPFISYVNPFTRSTFTSGQAIYRFVGVEMLSKLWNHETFAKAKEKWEAEKTTSYTSIYPDKDGNFIPDFDGNWNK